MARIIPNWTPHRHRRTPYNWDQLLDGRAWELTRGEDFTCSCESFRSQFYRQCRKRDFKPTVRIRRENGVERVQVLATWESHLAYGNFQKEEVGA